MYKEYLCFEYLPTQQMHKFKYETADSANTLYKLSLYISCCVIIGIEKECKVIKDYHWRKSLYSLFSEKVCYVFSKC